MPAGVQAAFTLILLVRYCPGLRILQRECPLCQRLCYCATTLDKIGCKYSCCRDVQPAPLGGALELRVPCAGATALELWAILDAPK